MDGFSILFTVPQKQIRDKSSQKKNLYEILEERLQYNTAVGKYFYSIKYKPISRFSNTNIISHLDLDKERLGF